MAINPLLALLYGRALHFFNNSDCRIKRAVREAELDDARAAQRDLIWTGAGLLIAVLGLAAAVWGSAFGVSKVEAGMVILAGLGIGALPWAMESDLSAWVVAPVAAIVALRGIVYIWSLGWAKRK